MRRLLPALALFLLLLLAGTYWLAGREATLRWALDKVVEASEGRLSFSGVSGNLLGTVKVDQGGFVNRKAEVKVARLVLDFSLSALFDRRLAIDHLQAETLSVRLVPSDEPPQLPESLTLPIGIEVSRLQIGRLDIQRGDFAVSLQQLEAGFVSSGRSHSLDLRGVGTPWGGVKASLKLEGKRPFALEGQAELAPAPDQRHLPQLKLGLQGSLAKIQASLAARGSWLQASADALVLPFAEIPLADLKAQLDRLDLRGLDTSLPKAIIAGQLSGKQTGEARFAGRLALGNQTPGALADGDLPLTTFDAGFSAEPQQLIFDDLRLGLRHGAPLTGNARLARDGITAQLKATALDLKAFHDRLATTRLAGTLEIQADAEVQRAQAQLADSGQRYVIDARRQGDLITLHQGSLRSGASRVELQGQLTARKQWPFTARGRLTAFNPAAFGDFPSARINATLSGSGQLSPDWQVSLAAEIADSVFEQQPLSGKLQATLTQKRIQDSRGNLAWGRNRAVFHGSLGAASDRLEVERIEVDLHSVDANWTGLAKGSATLSGRLRYPAAVLRMQASDLKGPGQLAIGKAELTADVSPELDAPLAIQAQLSKAKIEETLLDRVILSLAGTGNAHQIKLVAAGKDLVLEAGLAGGLDKQLTWRGQLQRFQLEQPRVFQLEAPASLVLSRTRLELGETRISSDKTLFHLDRLSMDAAGLRTAGRFTGLPVSLLGLPLRRSVRSEGLMGGEWEITANDRLNGHLKLRHESGVWVVDAPARFALRPTQGKVDVIAKDNRIALAADLSLRDGSQLDLEMATEVHRKGPAWSISPDAPFSLKAKGKLVSLERWGRMLNQDLALEGNLALDITGKGTWHHPAAAGTIEGREIGIRHLPSGMSFSNGRLQARLDGEQILVDAFELQAGEGRLRIDGLARLGENPDLRLHFKGERLAVVERRDLDLDTDVEGDLAVDRKSVSLSGKISVNRGMLILSDSYAPSLSSDVRIKGRPVQPQAEQRELGLALDLTVDLGRDFRVRSSEKGQLLGGKLPFQTGGLNTRITGQVRMQGERGETVKSSGEIKVVDGSYYLLGQRLDIERGTLRFDGPLLNPVLDISAVREKPQMKAGLTISGTAQNPRARLFSEPEVPDQEKLSWLLFGRGGQPVDSSLGSVTGRAQGFLSSFGFQVSERLYVAYEQSATGTENFVSFYSALTDQLSIEARAGDENALQLFYTFTLGNSKKASGD